MLGALRLYSSIANQTPVIEQPISVPTNVALCSAPAPQKAGLHVQRLSKALRLIQSLCSSQLRNETFPEALCMSQSLFFEAERSRFFRPLNGSRRELVAACLRALYDRLHGPAADYAHNLNRTGLITAFRLSRPGKLFAEALW